MKKRKLLGVALLMGLISIGCTKTPGADQAYKSESKVGYIMMEGDTLYFDEVEVITTEDKNRIAELGLTMEKDLPSGYYIYNPVAECIALKLTENTSYTFTDFDLLFTKEENANRIYQTTKKQEFLEGSSYQDIPLEAQKIPYFLDVYEGEVIRITEEFIYTQ